MPVRLFVCLWFLGSCVTLADAPAGSDAPAAVSGDAEVSDLPLAAPPESTASDPGRIELDAKRITLFPVDDPKWLADPFPILEMEMVDAATDLSKGKTAPPAKVVQPRILNRLDLMIAELEKKCSSGGGSSSNPSRPAEASVLRKGAERKGELRAAEQQGRQWAKLSPKDREKVLQSQTEGFPPGYEAILADYFRRVSRTESPSPAPGAASTE